MKVRDLLNRQEIQISLISQLAFVTQSTDKELLKNNGIHVNINKYKSQRTRDNITESQPYVARMVRVIKDNTEWQFYEIICPRQCIFCAMA